MEASGPPQEGLDPKLRVLTDLAPADVSVRSAPDPTAAVPVPVGPVVAEGGTVSKNAGVGASAGAATGNDVQRPIPTREQPPQVGQDPKLAACVNDGETIVTSNDTSASVDAMTSDANNANGNGAQAAPSVAVPDPTAGVLQSVNLKTEHTGASAGGTDTGTVPPPATTAVAATMTSIQQTASAEPEQENSTLNAQAQVTVEDGSEQGAAKAPSPSTSKTQSQANSKPNLTSSESLAEWNRIHASNGPTYDFFKKSQVAKKMASAKEAPKIEELIETSKARVAAAAANANASGMTPLFTLNAESAATFAHSADGTTSTSTQPQYDYQHPSNSNQHSVPPIHHLGVAVVPTIPAHPQAQAQHPQPVDRTNSNFWLQEEEERFLFGLRLYGWGQWKRIQTIVQTRTNKQIKSHAQKREKVNPEIKFKYGKGKSRRGRISSKVLADDARAMAIAGGSVGDVANAVLGSNDETQPSLDQAWMDVYGTNNGDGPNSRSRRYRQQHRFVPAPGEESAAIDLHPQSSSATHSEEQQQDNQPALLEHGKGQVKEEPPPRSLQESLANPLYKQPTTTTMEHYNQHMEASRVAAAGGGAPASVQTHQAVSYGQQTGLQPENAAAHYPVAHHRPGLPPPLAPHATYAPPIHHPPPPHAPQHYAHWHQQAAYSSTAVPLPETMTTVVPLPETMAPPVFPPNQAGADMANNTGIPARATNVLNESPSKKTDTTSLRPGMRIYSRAKSDDDTSKSTWSPGTIYSAKVDPTKLSEESVPLIYHIQYDAGDEDPNVPEDLVMSKAFYEETISELEKSHALPRPADYKPRYPQPLDMGVPVYCQWMDMYVPEMHGRWMPGTIHSYQQIQDGTYYYHILFDNEQEKQNIPQQYVLDRTEYHDLTKLKHQAPKDLSLRPVGELYNVFLRKHDGITNYFGENAADGTNQQPATPQQPVPATSEAGDDEQKMNAGQLDLLFTASQMRADPRQQTMATATEKRKHEAIADVQKDSNKRHHTDIATVEV